MKSKIKKKHIVITVLFLIILLFILPCLIGKSKYKIGGPPPSLYKDYSTVSFLLMDLKGNQELYDMDEMSLHMLFDIWKFRIDKECLYNKELTERAESIILSTLDKSGEDYEKRLENEVVNFFRICTYEYIYRNKDEIYKTIKDTYRISKKRRCPYCLFYKIFY